MKPRFASVLSMALILAFAWSGCAYAENAATLLERLFPYSSPGKAVRALVEPVNLTKADGPCSLTVDEVLFDGSALYIRWTARSDSKDLTLLTAGKPQSPTAALEMQGESRPRLPNGFTALGGTLNGKKVPREYNGLFSALVTDHQTLEPFELTIRGYFLKPTARIVCDTDIKDGFSNQPTWVASETGAEPSLNCYSDVQIDGNGDYTMKQDDIFARHDALPKNPTPDDLANAYLQGITELGYAQLLSKIELTFTVTPVSEYIHHTQIDGPSTFELDDRTITFTKADFTVTQYEIVMVMTAKDDKTWSEDIGRLSYTLYADGKELLGRITTRSEDSENEPATVTLTYKGVPLSDVPSTLAFAAFWSPVEPSIPSTNPMLPSPERDITIRLKKIP